MRPFGYTAGIAAALAASFWAQLLARQVLLTQQVPAGQRVFRPVLLPGAYRIADGVVGPIPLKKVTSGWSPEAKTAHLERTAIVTDVIGADGVPVDMRITRSIGFGLDEKALEAIAQWKFVPAAHDDRPIPVFASTAIDFRLPAGPFPLASHRGQIQPAGWRHAAFRQVGTPPVGSRH